MRHFITLLLIMTLALVSGCQKRSAEVKKTNTLKTQAYVAASEGKAKIIDAILIGLKKSEYERIDLKIDAEVQRQLAEVRKNVAADGKVNADVAIVGMMKLVEFRDSEREKHRATVDARIEQIRSIVSATDDQLAIALKLDDLISEYDDAGVDLSGVRNAVTQILDTWKKPKQSAAAEIVPLK